MVVKAVSIHTHTNDIKNNIALTGLAMRTDRIISKNRGSPAVEFQAKERSKSAPATFPTMNELSKWSKFRLWRSFSFKSKDFMLFVLNQ